MKTLSILLITTLCVTAGFAQVTESEISEKEHPFVNITEIGGMFGRVLSPAYYYTPYYYASSSSSSYYVPPSGQSYEVRNVANITLQTFNGVYINPKTAVGITTGLDWYNNTLIVPLEAGVRRKLFQRKSGGAAIITGLDAGYGTTWFHKDNPENKTSGGFAISPTIGYRMPSRSGSAWVLNFGYKHQSVTIRDTRQFDENYSSVETRSHNRLVVRFGFEF
ncbi:MAG: hypothetical protein NWP83_03615 [Spirosomaceae bacterium]|nr:hypothetical protein [Spirosomataceae bacterium]